MKWMKAVACTALLALSGPAFCDEGQTESPGTMLLVFHSIRLFLPSGIG
ncbi:Uncharacterised protein [Enterobacter asburiae]|uniref:Uncharacterized protein n=1 Tax=Enterobacter asburiae TaxID=61645 RepID=A0A376F4K3_ENTAS|nr:Uncharacterised protein [Enterobacter asburiae]